MIGGRQYAPGSRGLNFVVFDIIAKNLLDVVNFDTYSDNFRCSRPSAITDGLLEYQNAHPEVSVLCFRTPVFPDADLSDNEKFIRQYDLQYGMILKNADKQLFALNKDFSAPEEIFEVLTPPKSYHNLNGVRRLKIYA